MRQRVWWIIATIVIVFSLLAVVFSTVAQNAYQYDTNGNNRIDDEELLRAVDDWLARTIDDQFFYEILDFWALGGNVIRGIPSSNQDCPAFTELNALRNGITFGSSSNSIHGAAISSPIDIAFAEEIYLPAGTTIEINLRSLSPGLTSTDAFLRSPLPNQSFANSGNGHYVNTVTLQSGNVFPRNYEWMSFTPDWTGSETNGTLRVETFINAPSCGTLNTNISIHLVRGSTSNTPPPSDPGCPGGTRLMGLRGGVPLGPTSASGVHAAGTLTTPIDIAFRQDTFLPAGTTVEFRIKSGNSGLEPRNGVFNSPFSSSTFRNNGPLELIGNASIQNGTNVADQYEWGGFTPYWDDNTFSGEFDVSATFTAPGCQQVTLTTKITMTKTTTGTPPPTNDPNCPNHTSILGMRGGVPMGASTSFIRAASLTRPIDIAFKDQMYLPLGTTIQLSVTSDTSGLEPWNGEFFSPITSGGFSTTNPLHLIGNGSVGSATSIPAQYEWASFTPYWSDSTSSGRFVIQVTINAPGCNQLELSRGFTMRKITSATDARVQVTQHPSYVSFSTLNNAPIQLNLWTLSGEPVFTSGFGSRVLVHQNSEGQRLANGVYLYVVRERTQDGTIRIHDVKKLVLMR